MKASFNRRSSCFYLARDAFTDTTLSSESNQGRIRPCLIALLKRRLQRLNLISVHQLSPANENRIVNTVSYFFEEGLMFWFTRKRLLGSYLFLMATNRS